MNKKQWKQNYTVVRTLYRAAINMENMKKTPARVETLDFVWSLAEKLNVAVALQGRYSNYIYSIKKHKWAIKSNSRNY